MESMTRFLKILFSILGAMFIGFGLGLVLADALILTFAGVKYWLLVSGALIFGGFLLGLSFIKKIPPKKVLSDVKTEADAKKKEKSFFASVFGRTAADKKALEDKGEKNITTPQ